MIVIAKYKEDISWAYKVNQSIKVYDKSADYPNFGREAETYLRHIIENYKDLDNLNIFCQGDPFAHCGDFLQLIEQNQEGLLGDWTVIESNTITNHWHKLPIEEFMSDLGLKKVNSYTFTAGAQFILKNKTITKRPKKFYVLCRELMDKYPDAPWILERIWPIIFNTYAVLRHNN